MCKYWIKNCIYARYTFFFLKRSKTCGPRLTDREREWRVTRCVNELENWKLLFIVVFNEYKWNTKEGVNRSECLLRSIEPRSNFRSKYRLQACTSVTSYRAAFEHLRVTRERVQLASFKLRARFIIMAAVFDRFVIPSFFIRASPLLFPGCFHSRVLLQFPIRIGYFRVTPGLEFIPGGEKIAASNLGD